MTHMPDTDSFDLVVIGAGPAGYVAAIRAAQLGMSVACVEKDVAPGGTCLNVGCIPSKALLHSSHLFSEATSGLKAHGIQTGDVSLDLSTMMKRKDRVVKVLTRGIAGLFKKNGVTLIRGRARFAGPGAVTIDEGPDAGRRVQARNILIASGSVPIELPDLPFDGSRIIDSTAALALERVPDHLVVVGAGAIGLELGSVWSRLGARVTVVELTPGVTPGMDVEMSGLLRRALEKQGLTFRFETRVASATTRSKGVTLTLRDPANEISELEADVALVAVGRRAHAEGLGLEALGLDLDERGRIPVDEAFATAVPGVHAIGDVIAGPMLAHKAEEEGVACVERLAGLAGHVNYEAIPAVVYTHPEFAAVGRTEEQLRADGTDIRVGRFPYAGNGRARTMGETDGAVKVLADAETDRILGIHIVGAGASDLIAEATVAIEFGASAEDLARSVHAHPTLPEALKEAALAVDGRALHV